MVNRKGKCGSSDRFSFFELHISVEDDSSHEIKKHLHGVQDGERIG